MNVVSTPRRVAPRRRRLLALSLVLPVVVAAGDAALARGRDARGGSDAVSPSLQIQPRSSHDGHRSRPKPPAGVRSLDGSGNHLADPDRNATYTVLVRSVPADYADGVSSLAGPDRPGAREVSNIVSAQAPARDQPLRHQRLPLAVGPVRRPRHRSQRRDGSRPSPPRSRCPPATRTSTPAEPAASVIPFNRSLYDPETGTDPDNPRQQLNQITRLDRRLQRVRLERGARPGAATQRRHGPARRRARRPAARRRRQPAQRHRRLGPGDVPGRRRARERAAGPHRAPHALHARAQPAGRSHPSRRSPAGRGRRLRARPKPGGRADPGHHLPGVPAGPARPGRPPALPGLRPGRRRASPQRVLHRRLPLRPQRAVAPSCCVSTRAWTSCPRAPSPCATPSSARTGCATKAASSRSCGAWPTSAHQRIDVFVVDDVRNFLFGPPGAGGFDLPALNIQRGRDHGLPGYNDTREAYGLPRAAGFEDDDQRSRRSQARLAAAYGSVDDVDLWVGGLAEDPLPGSAARPPLPHHRGRAVHGAARRRPLLVRARARAGRPGPGPADPPRRRDPAEHPDRSRDPGRRVPGGRGRAGRLGRPLGAPQTPPIAEGALRAPLAAAGHPASGRGLSPQLPAR